MSATSGGQRGGIVDYPDSVDEDGEDVAQLVEEMKSIVSLEEESEEAAFVEGAIEHTQEGFQVVDRDQVSSLNQSNPLLLDKQNSESDETMVDEANEAEIEFLTRSATLDSFECDAERNDADVEVDSSQSKSQDVDEMTTGGDESVEQSATAHVARGRKFPIDFFERRGNAVSPLRAHPSFSTRRRSASPELNRNSLRSRSVGPVVETPPLSDHFESEAVDMSPISCHEEAESSSKKEVSDTDYQPPSSETKTSRRRKQRKRAAKRKHSSESLSASPFDQSLNSAPSETPAQSSRKKAKMTQKQSSKSSIVRRSTRKSAANNVQTQEGDSSASVAVDDVNCEESDDGESAQPRQSPSPIPQPSAVDPPVKRARGRPRKTRDSSASVVVDDVSCEDIDVGESAPPSQPSTPIPQSSAFDPPVKRARGRPRKTQPLAGCLPVAGTGAKKRRALPKVADSLFVDANSNTADPLVNDISGAFAFVPPTFEENRDRVAKTAAELDVLISGFINNHEGFELVFEELQHEERLSVIRRLVTLAFGDEHTVEPFLRLMRENMTREDDPWQLVVRSLSDALIDTRRATMTSSFQSLIFAYASVLFLQHWGIMPAGTTTYSNWGLLGLRFQNWEKIGLWTEFFALSPVLVTAVIQNLLSTRSLNMHKEFQTELLKILLEDEDLLKHWFYLRQKARKCYRSKSGESLLMDLLPFEQIWIYRGAIALKIDELEEAYENSTEEERDSFLIGANEYSDSSVYRDSVATVSDLLASANSDSSYARKVAFYVAFQRQLENLPTESWLRYEGNDSVRQLAVGILNKLKIELSETSIGDDALSLKFVLQDELDEENEECLHFILPLAADILARLRNSQRMEILDIDAASPLNELPAERSVTVHSTSSLIDTVLISEFVTEETEEQLCNAVVGLARVREITIDRRVGQVLLRLHSEIETDRVLNCLMACSSISPVLHCIAGTNFELQQLFTHVSQVGADAKPASENCVRFPSSAELAIAFDEISSSAFKNSSSLRMLCHEAQARLDLEESFVNPELATLDNASIGARLSTETGDPYSFVDARHEFASLPSTSDEEARASLVFLLREIAAIHLRQNPQDSLDVAPCDWLKMDGDVETAAEGKLLQSANVGSHSLANLRCVLFGDIVNGEPVALMLFYPDCFAMTPFSLFSPIIFVFGYQLSRSSLRKLLLTLFWRLDGTGPEMFQNGRCCLFDLHSPKSNLSPIEILWKLAHAVRISLVLSSSSSTAFFSSELYVDDRFWKETESYLKKIWGQDEVEPEESSIREVDWIDWNSQVAASGSTSLTWLSLDYDRIFYEFLWRRQLRAQCDESWCQTAAFPDSASIELNQVRVRLVLHFLKQKPVTRKLALYKRIQLLFRRGFKLISVAASTLSFQRGLNEFTVLKANEFSLRAGMNLYTNEDEIGQDVVRFSSVPIW